MTAPVVTEQPESSTAVLTAVLRLRGVSALPITRADGTLAGIVSTTDILRVPHAARADELMSTPVVTASPDEPLDDAARRLVAARVHRMVVTEGDRVVGILSTRDILAELKNRKLEEPLSRAMTAHVESIDVGASVQEAVTRLTRANVRGLVVVDGSTPVGVFTQFEALAARKLPASHLAGPVEDLMSYETICLDARTPIHRAAGYAVAMNVRRILVVDQRKLAGIVSSIDLVDVLARAPDA
ncbi:MAG TPA: CBS domain-containing protein [Labilithrix sp.]|nr:CBS domain-containing protein [Labilithrix sp.]